MARVPVDEFYNVQRNILDRVGTDSVDSDQLKGIAALFGIDVFKRLIKRKEDVLDDNIEAIEQEGIIRNGRNNVLWEKRNKVLEDDILIKKDALKFFDADAESVFNNPTTHEKSEYKKDNPDWIFNPQEFADETSPMYKVKEKWKQDYINQVLLPQHNNKYNQINQDILTFDEYNADNREVTKHAIEYAKRPSERSLLRQWNLFGRKRTAKLKSDYEKAREDAETIRLEREGYLLHNNRSLVSIDPKTGDTYGSTLEGTKRYGKNFIVKPLSGLTKELYETGEIYNEFEFKNTDNYKALSVQGKAVALSMFKNNENYKDKNNSYELSNIFSSVALSEEEFSKMTRFEFLKYNDPDFKKDKPKRNKGETREQYEARDDFIDWKASVDEAYGEDKPKYIRAREKAGYDMTMSDEMNLAIEDNLDYFVELRAEKRKLDNNEITEEEYNKTVKSFKEKTISNLIKKELGATDDKQEFINSVASRRTGDFFNTLKTEQGKELMDEWFTNYNRRRVDSGRSPEAPSNKLSLYSAHMTKIIQDETAFLTNFLIIDEVGNIGYDESMLPDPEFIIDPSLVD